MDKTPIHTDEFGTISFSIHQEDGHIYVFEQGQDSHTLFITLKDEKGVAIGKRVVNTKKPNNKEIVEVYNDYLKEHDEESTEGKPSLDDE